MSSSLDISIDTSEILDNAEKLVDDVEKKIAQINYDIKNFRFDDNSYADESVLYIRDVVNTKFKELNRDIFPLDDNYCFDENQIEYQHYNCEERKNNAIKLPRVFSLDNNKKQTTNEEQKSGSESKPQLKVKIKKGILNKTDSIKSQSSQLSAISSLKVDLLPNDNNIIKKINYNIPEFKNDSCERKEKKERSVDIAVQTSIQEISHEKLASLDKSPDLLTEKNISSDSISNDKIKPETINPGDGEQHLSRTHLQQRIVNYNTKKSNGSFIEFMYQIAELETNNLIEMNSDDLIEENQHYLSYNKTTEVEIINDDFDFNKIDLYSPKFEHVDKRLNNFDKKMKTFAENTNELVNIFSRIILCNKNNNNNFKVSKSDTRENNFDEVKLSFKPQSINLSSETTITSESLKTPERCSTPLANYSVNIDTKNICNDTEKLSTPIMKPDMNNDSKFFTTRNKHSLSASSTKENCHKVNTHDKSEIEFRLSESLQKIQKQINEKIYSDECHDLSYNNGVKKLDCQQETEVNNEILNNSFKIINQKICDNKKKQFETTKSSISNEKTLSKSIKLRQSSKNTPLQINQNVEPDHVEMNLVVDSSKDDLRDRTSFDVSAIYSESFETASFSENEITSDELKKSNNDQIENFKLKKKNDAKFELCLSIGSEKYNINDNNFIEELKDKLQTSEKIIPISVNEKNDEKSSINQADSLNLSIQSLTKKSEDKNHTSSLSLESCQLPENILSVKILQEKREKSSSGEYSEGELPLPISLGEVRVNDTPDSPESKNSNYYQSLTDHIHNILNLSLQSLGEILNSNGDSTSSVTSHMAYDIENINK